jgi:hypothetical protein
VDDHAKLDAARMQSFLTVEHALPPFIACFTVSEFLNTPIIGEGEPLGDILDDL